MLEKIAKVQHEIWTHWMEYLFDEASINEDGSVTLSAEDVARWKRQISTDYEQLSEKEKESDREQARKVIDVLSVSYPSK